MHEEMIKKKETKIKKYIQTINQIQQQYEACFKTQMEFVKKEQEQM